jgi:ribosomal protein S18 acetylase RimI-like enzyme
MELKLVQCTEEYWEFVRLLRMDPINQEGFFTKANITPEQQKEFMIHNWSKYKICLANNEPAGYVGLLYGHEITYCVHPNFHGKGIGSYMIEEFSKPFSSVDAFVKVDNTASQKVFEKLGWEKQIYYKRK